MRDYFYAVEKKNVYYYTSSKGLTGPAPIFSVERRDYRIAEDSKDEQAVKHSLVRNSLLCYDLDDLKELNQVISEVIAKEEKEGGTV